MKKYVIYLMALVFAISCVKEVPHEDDPTPGQETIGSIVFSAEIENNEVKTMLGDGEAEKEKVVLWNKDDDIAVCIMGDDEHPYIYKFRTEDEGKNRADFHGPVVQGEAEVEGPISSGDYEFILAVYPYSLVKGITCIDSEYAIFDGTLPATQTYVKDSFGKEAFPMVAVPETKDDTSLKFKNLCGAIKLQICGDNIPIKSISIRGNDNDNPDEVLCGHANINYEGGDHLFIDDFDKDYKREVVLDCSKANVVLKPTEPTAFYIVLRPATFTKGITLTIITKNNTVIKKTTSQEVVINRSGITPVSPFTIRDVAPVYKEGDYEFDAIPVLGDWDGDGTKTILYWAPVNCGYAEDGTVASDNDHRLGKLYQWGAGDSSLPYMYEGSPVEARAMYIDAATPSPWYDENVIKGTSQDKWNNNQGPCPTGWRLPTGQEFEVLCGPANESANPNWVLKGTYADQSNTYPGAEFFGANTPTTAGTGVFFPAAGYRHGDDGHADGSYSGHYWSSTNNGSSTHTYRLGFYSTQLKPKYADRRAAAYSVRCVKGYGDPQGEVHKPIELETRVKDVLDNSGKFGYEFISKGEGTITKIGVCYTTEQVVPTITNSKVRTLSVTEGSVYVVERSLTPNTTYYVRAFATNEYGTYYGDLKTVTTLESYPYEEDGQNFGNGIAMFGNWDGNASTPNTVLYWAPVNCGYKAAGTVGSDTDHRFGKIYQWGAGDQDMYSKEASELYYNEQEPELPKDLMGTNTDKWNNNQGPCPTGWRLPTAQEFVALSANKNGNGWVEEGTYAGQSKAYSGAEFFGAEILKVPGRGVFFPAAPYYEAAHMEGTMYVFPLYVSSGNDVAYWTSSTDSQYFSNALFLNKSSDKDLQVLYKPREEACSVRCVKGEGDPNGEVHNPAVLTTTVGTVADNLAVCGGNITSEGDAAITACGVCYTTSNFYLPALDNAHYVTSTPEGLGAFTCELTALQENTKYYVRAYVVNKYGTYYGKTQTFKTSSSN